MKTHTFIKDAPEVPADPWGAVEGECPGKLGRHEHAGRLHVLHGAAVVCVAWRPLHEHERATDAWIDAARRRVRVETRERAIVLGVAVEAARIAWPLEVPGAREALYAPPELMRFQMSDAAELDAKAVKLAVELQAYYASHRRPITLPPVVKVASRVEPPVRRRAVEFA